MSFENVVDYLKIPFKSITDIRNMLLNSDREAVTKNKSMFK